MTEIDYGSFCTGYDGIGLGLTLAGLNLRHRFMAEVEPAMSRVLKREHDGVPNVGDLKAAPWSLAPRVRIVSSGDPCQSISIAGRQAGRDDPRFLWPWVRTAYREILPPFLFFENVANIVSHDDGRTLAERFEHLREDGYAVRWTVLGACAVGAPHHRHRWYALAAHVGPGAPAAVRVGGGKAICGAPRSGGRWLLPTPRTTDTNGPGRTATLQGGNDLRTAVSLLPTPRATDIGTPGRRSSEGWRPQLGQAVQELLPTPRASDGPNGGPNQRNGRGEYDALPGLVVNLLPTPTTSNAHGNHVNSRGELLLPGITARPEVWGKYAEAVALWEELTGVPAPAPTEPGRNGGPRLSAELPEWMMGLRPGLLTGELSRPEALKGAGNGCVPQAVAAAYRMLSAG